MLSWIAKWVTYHLGFTLLIAGAGLATAMVTGNSAVVVAIAIMSALLFGTLVKDPRRSQGGKRRPGGPFSVTHRWRVEGRPNLDDIWHALSREELALSRETRVPGRVVLRGGSHLWMRLIGGYFINPKRLPVRAELTRSDVSGVDGCVVELAVRDRFGVAVRDELVNCKLTNWFTLLFGRPLKPTCPACWSIQRGPHGSSGRSGGICMMYRYIVRL